MSSASTEFANVVLIWNLRILCMVVKQTGDALLAHQARLLAVIRTCLPLAAGPCAELVAKLIQVPF